jgi:hypothetical protein
MPQQVRKNKITVGFRSNIRGNPIPGRMVPGSSFWWSPTRPDARAEAGVDMIHGYVQLSFVVQYDEAR